MTQNDHTRWYTVDEKNFIKTLNDKSRDLEERIELLQKYKESISHRVNWGLINRKQIVGYVDRELKKLVAKSLKQYKGEVAKEFYYTEY